MNLPLLLIGAGLAFVAASRKSPVAIASAAATGEPPEYAKVRIQLQSDLDSYFASVPDVELNKPGKLVGLFFTRSPRTGSPSGKDVEQLSNAVEWASKCYREGGKCHSGGKVTPHISDDTIIEGSVKILPAVVAFFYPNLSPEAQANFVINVVKETTTDVKNLQWRKYMLIATLIIAPLTAGIAVVGTAATAVTGAGELVGGSGILGLGAVQGILTTLPASLGAGLSVAGAAKSLGGGSEGDAKKVLTGIFQSIKTVKVNLK